MPEAPDVHVYTCVCTRACAREVVMNCEEWLWDLLSREGPMDYRWVKDEARKQMFTKSELKRARAKIGAITEHLFGIDDNGTWYWRLPDERKPD